MSYLILAVAELCESMNACIHTLTHLFSHTHTDLYAHISTLNTCPHTTHTILKTVFNKNF